MKYGRKSNILNNTDLVPGIMISPLTALGLLFHFDFQSIYYVETHYYVPGTQVQEHLAPGSQADPDEALATDKTQRQRNKWWGNKKEICIIEAKKAVE